MTNELLLLSGGDIPFIEAQVVIHQPTIKEIAYIGQEAFYIGCQYLNFSKDNLKGQDKNDLKDYDNFEILMTIIRGDNVAVKKDRVCVQMLLLLLFPDYTINFLPTSIMLSKYLQNGKKQMHLIDKNNFEEFKNIVNSIFCFNHNNSVSSKYNPGGPQAKALVQKFKKRQQKLASLKNRGEKTQTSIFSQYISILSVGEKKDMNKLLQYTVYQLFNQFRRFRMKEQYDIYVKAKMAGAKDLEDVDNWMGVLTSKDN